VFAANNNSNNNSSSAIVNINSIVSFVNFPSAAGTYSASKEASHSLIQAQRREFAPFKTLVIGVYPGPIWHGHGRKHTNEKKKHYQVSWLTKLLMPYLMEQTMSSQILQVHRFLSNGK
jgi:NAD(P)-dependent dehydrogenase (short-subunit alcohol dehydrogenase family)